MGEIADRNRIYFCPMHSGVQQSHPGQCPKCGRDLVQASTRFALLRYMASNPFFLAMMAAVVVAMMAAAMMMR
jgi:hypothetical protein